MIDPRMFAASDEGLELSIPRFLFAVVGAPVIWALHLAACYFLVTLDCITAWNGGVWSVIAVTVACAAGSGTAGWSAWRSWRRIGNGGFHPAEHEWRRFLLLIGLAGSILFTATIVATGIPPLIVDVCV